MNAHPGIIQPDPAGKREKLRWMKYENAQMDFSHSGQTEITSA